MLWMWRLFRCHRLVVKTRMTKPNPRNPFRDWAYVKPCDEIHVLHPHQARHESNLSYPLISHSSANKLLLRRHF